jgi:triacylglycerol esterase/lipase EstA (alpha/beta hydrolase family)
MPSVLIFLHGLWGNENSWEAVPDFLRKSMGKDFEIATPTYSANVFSPATIETSAGQILTLINTRYVNHEAIYLIGHSLGGLIVREICRTLLLQGPDDLLNKIPAAITAGTPLEGASWGNYVLRKLGWFSPKLARIADPDTMFAEYRAAIREAEKREVRRPVRHQML